MKMELIEGSETSAIRTQTTGNYPKENILQFIFFLKCITSNFRSLSSLWFEMLSIFYLLHNNIHC